MPIINILIADDHPVVRRGLKQILSETPDMVVSGETADGDEVISMSPVKLHGYRDP